VGVLPQGDEPSMSALCSFNVMSSVEQSSVEEKSWLGLPLTNLERRPTVSR
jgi:hypothetical protein